MLAIPVGIYMVAAVCIVSAIPYEDNPRNSPRQHATLVTDVEEMLFVVKQTRSRALVPITRCQAILKLRQARAGLYQYNVYYMFQGASNTVDVFVSTVATSTTHGHMQPNALSYQTIPDGPVKPYKVMYADQHRGCFILVTTSPSFGRACRLLRSDSTVNGPVPPDCLRVFRESCPRDNLLIYIPYCRLMIARAANRQS